MNREVLATSSYPAVVTSRHEIRDATIAAKHAGKTVGIVPTMGALHSGHLSLVESSTQECDVTIVTIFVNPTQFGPNEDFQQYPRDVRGDLESLSDLPVDYVFVPSREEMYSSSHSTYVQPPDVAGPLEGECRPGHFQGVTTIVLKLFQIIPADVAYFGHKDYQQSLVIRRMVEDLDMPITIRVCPTVREPDGLALSSRNAYLSSAERQQALAISGSLALAAELVQEGELDAAKITDQMRARLSSAGINQIDYVALVHPETLAAVPCVKQATIAVVAAYVGKIRLIDNRLLA